MPYEFNPTEGPAYKQLQIQNLNDLREFIKNTENYSGDIPILVECTNCYGIANEKDYSEMYITEMRLSKRKNNILSSSKNKDKEGDKIEALVFSQ